MRKIFTLLLPFLIFTSAQAQNGIALQNKKLFPDVIKEKQIASSSSGNFYRANILHSFNDRSNLAFIENKGQWNAVEGLENKNILFSFNDGGTEVYFTNKGLFYTISKYEQVSESEWERETKFSAKEKEENNKPKYLTRTKTVEMNWENANPNVKVLGNNPTSFYFNYYMPTDADKKRVIGNVKGFTKIVYENIYPNIDIEYTIHPKEGIKYSFILHPGADVSKIKMSYSGAAVEKNREGNIILSTSLGNITDHAPLTYTGIEPSGKIIDSKFILLDNNSVGFKLKNNVSIVSETTVIDPWTVGPSFSGKYFPNDLAVDGSNNIYVYGEGTSAGSAINQIFKFTSAGVLVWTFNLVSGADYLYTSQGDIAVDPSGNSYVCDGLQGNATTNYNTIKINPAGTALLWGSTTTGNSSSGIYETWTLNFNCDYTKLYQSGGGTYITSPVTTYFNVGDWEPLNTSTGAEGTLVQHPELGEIMSSIFATNGYYYVLSADSNLCACPTGGHSVGVHNRLSCYNVSTGANVWSNSTSYSYIDGDAKQPYANGPSIGSVGFNALAASCNYLYSMNGAKLDRWNLTTGAHYNQVTITGGTTTLSSVNSGIVTDKCGNVYVGSAGAIYVYDPLLNLTNTISGLPGTVFDLAWGSNYQLFACGGATTGTTFLASVAVPTCNTAASGMTVTPTQPVGCGGLGSATVTATFCAAPYTYAWSPSGGNSSAATGLAAGNYTVIVSGSAQCPYTFVDTAVVTINSGAGTLATTQSQVNLNCNGVCIGSGTVTPSGGTAPYTYAWSPSGGNSSTATGLCAGTFTCAVHDASGCASNPTITITQPAVVTASISSTTVSCNGGNNGSATVTAGGGTPNYTYSWSPSGGNSSAATGLSTGNYTVTVTDSKGCTKTATVSIAQPTPVTASISSQVNVSCNGGNNGSATASGSGGASPYTYVWNTSPAQTAVTATGLSAVNYTVTTSDANGCTGTQTVSITQPPVVTASIGSSTSISCNGGNNGNATVSAGGGTPNYTYSWNPTGQTTTSATGLSVGNYTATVTDSKGCTKTTTVAISQPTAITVTTSTTNANCGTPNGTASTGASGGTPAYTYSWSNGQTTTTATGLIAGSYTITATDNNGCTKTSVANVSNAGSPTVTITSSTNISCNGGSNGTASVSATGGTSPYTFSWCNGQTTTSATGLSAGSCNVTVTDAGGCISVIAVPLTEPAVLTTALSSSSVTCNGGNNATATVIAGGGTPAYTYSWSTGGQTTSSATGLSFGNYTVTITDSKNCTSTGTVSIAQPSAVTASISSQTNILCNGGNNASVTASGSGGNSPYTYVWNSSPAQSSATASGLTAGNYTVTTTDANGCTGTQTVSITQPNAITNSFSQNNVSCNGGNDGTATATPSGGTSPFTYSWSTGETSATATGLISGNYSVTITDANGCSLTNTISVSQPTALTTTTTVTPAGCSTSNGTATSSPTGGTPGYTYSWSNGQTTATATGLSVGSYNVNITDAKGCTVSNAVSIVNTGAPSLTVTPTNLLCNGGTNGNATATVSGGNSPYTFSWSNGQTVSTATGLSSGNYTVTVTDASGCSQVSTVFVSQPSALTASPTQNNVSCNGGNNGDATANPFGGTPAYTYSWSNGQSNATTTGLTNGNYSVTITDANGCTATTTISISQPTAITNTMTTTLANCSASNGTAASNPSGGTGSYTYSWNNGQSAQTATGLAAGNYTLTITDANGCTATDIALISNAGAPTLTLTATTVSCNGGNNGSATATATGGNPAYTYSWSNSQTTQTATGLSSGTYIVTLTDASGCIVTNTVSVSQPTAITNTISTTPSGCITATGTATAASSGGTGSYTYNWNTTPAQSSATATGLSAGNYSLTITDANGCTVTDVATVTNANSPTVTVTSTTVSCNGGTNGNATANITGGTAPYTYSWNNGQTTSTATNLSAGNYTVMITDAAGCSQTNTVTLTQPNVISSSVNSTSACNSSSNGTASVTASGGTPSYSYAWNNGQTTSAATGLASGNYSITITDANGCSNTTTVTVSSATVTASIAGNTSFCNGQNSVLTASGGGTYSWTTGATTSSVTVSTGGNVSVIVSSGGCTDTATVNVNVSSGPSVNAGADVTILEGDNTSLTGSGGGTYTWNPSAGLSCTTCANPTANPASTTTYTLIVTDANGCSAEDSVLVFVIHKECGLVEDDIFIPNVFSPNNDGENDKFSIFSKKNCIQLFELAIFDRWGIEVFHTTQINDWWDGTLNGRKLSTAVFVYYCRITSSDNEVVLKKGNVTILR